MISPQTKFFYGAGRSLHSFFISRYIGALICVFLTCFVVQAEENAAFVLTGTFEREVSGKHFDSGTYTIKANYSNALVDITFENGFHELVGTDGHDTYTFSPFTGDRTTTTNANGIATISYGRFPKDGSFVEQLLWLACVKDRELLSGLQDNALPFYGNYTTNDIWVQVSRDGRFPGLIDSIRWYAPNYAVSGGKQYPLMFYTNGWKNAELVVESLTKNSMKLPAKIIFTEYRTFTLTNASQLKTMTMVERPPDDVIPLKQTVFSITSAQPDKPLQNYIPKMLDGTATLNDKRTSSGQMIVKSGAGWGSKEPAEAAHPRRLMKELCVGMISLILIGLLFKRARRTG